MMRIIYPMPRSAAHKAASHDRIVDVAASRIREAGVDAPGVAEIMREAGLTHRDDPGSGCAVVALGADASRANDRVRAAYTEQVQRYTEHLEQLLGGGKDARREAVASVAAMVGALLLARAVNDDRLSREILRDVADAVKRKR